MSFRLEGGRQLGKLSADLKKAGGKEMQRSLRKRLRQGVTPVLADVKAASPSEMVDRSLVLEFRYSERDPAVAIKAKRSRMPPGKQGLPQLLEFGSSRSGGRYIRHPVFGNREVYVNQPIRPYFFRTIEGRVAEVERVVAEVLDDVSRAAGFK